MSGAANAVAFYGDECRERRAMTLGELLKDLMVAVVLALLITVAGVAWID
jgi:hypothetical protein